MKKIFLVIFAVLLFSSLLFFKFFEKQNVVLKPEVVVEQVKQESSATVTLMFVGDIMLSRGVEYVAPRYKDPLFPFQNIATITQSADLTIGNLETPITKKVPYMVPYSLVFNSNPKYIERLQKAGFDILSSANNHSMDKGESGLVETMNYVKGVGMDSLGAGEDCHQGIMREMKGIRLGFLAYSYTGYNSGGHVPSELVCDWNDFEKVKADVLSLKQKVDHVIVLPHTGIEYATEPTEKDKQKMQELIDLGASAIVGAHPHVVQSVDNYKDGVIAYSLGNFVFDNQENPATEKGLILELVFDKQKILAAKKLPIRLKNFCCPELE